MQLALFDSMENSDITLTILSVKENLSVRATNVCRNNNLKFLSDILDYYATHKTFIRLRDCGKKTDKELVEVCHKYLPCEDEEKKENSLSPSYALTDISLKKLSKIEKMSNKATNLCRNNKLDSLNIILDYFYKNKTFLNLWSCGKKTEEELVNICQKYIKINEKKQKSKNIIPKSYSFTDISLEKLSKIENMPKEVNRFCKNHKLDSLYKILNYFNQFKTFGNLSNCDEITNRELKKISEKYINISSDLDKIIEKTNNEKPKKIDIEKNKNVFLKLSSLQLYIIKQYYRNRLNSLSKRAKNVLLKLFGAYPNLEKFHDKIFDKKVKLTKIEHCGKKTAKEIREFDKEIFDLVNRFITEASEKKIFIYFLKTLRKNLNIPGNLTIKYKNLFISHSFPLFKFINNLIENGYIFDESDLEIFYHRLNYRLDKDLLTLEEVGEKIGTTRERVRQLCERINSRIIGKLSHFILCLLYIDYDINLNTERNLIFVSKDFARNINMMENVNFTQKFYTKIFSIFVNETHKLFLENKRDETNVYLIKNELFEYFDFYAFYDDMETKLNEKIEETYTLNFEGYLFDFLKNNNIQILDIVKPICEKILFEDFDLILDLEDNITFEKNTRITIEDCAIEILKEIGNPMHLEEILEWMEMRYPGIVQNIRSLRGALLRSPLTISFGKTSTYGLKEWENEDDSIKTGSIKDLVEEFLQKFNEPKHINEIYNYVSKYRDMDKYKIYSNLHLDPHNRFVFFAGALIGVSTKDYSHVEGLKSPNRRKGKISREELIDAYYELKKKLGRIPTGTDMKKFGKYSAQVYRKNFGGWRKFLEFIGEK